ncbi:hypothetical protein HanHA300_Chr01g0022001 [Helianthus annuus]|nr:hypothetical protein HanHA300_Chr01g0022001 [Helianthus annuus]
MSELLVEILTYGILTKLSARDIGRCTLVCKNGCLFLSTLEFPLIHCRSTSPSATKWASTTLSSCESHGFFKKDSDSAAFYVDSANEYKVLHVIRRRGTKAVYIYSTRLHSWRKITDILSVKHGGEWSLGPLCGDGSILRFNVNLEQFSSVPLPCDFYGGGFDGSLLGYEEWINLWVLPCIGVVPSSFLGFVEYVESTDEMLLMTTCGDIYMLDMKTMQVGYYFPWKYMTALQGSVYFESLVSPNY